MNQIKIASQKFIALQTKHNRSNDISLVVLLKTPSVITDLVFVVVDFDSKHRIAFVDY